MVAAICFEGLGRKFVPSLPSPVFYFFKDAILIGGALAYGLSTRVVGQIRALYGPFILAFLAAVLWTALQLLNPQHESVLLGGFGFKAYWLWWLAPWVVASIGRRIGNASEVGLKGFLLCDRSCGRCRRHAVLQSARLPSELLRTFRGGGGN